MLKQNITFDALKTMLGADRVSTGHSDRELHSRDQSTHEAHLPDLVVWPLSTAEVSRVAAFANEHGIPLTGWGMAAALRAIRSRCTVVLSWISAV